MSRRKGSYFSSGGGLGFNQPVKRVWENGTPFKILIVGTFTQKKGIIISLQAIEKIIKDHAKTPIEVTIIGDARKRKDEQKIKLELLDFVNSTTLKNKTGFYGYLPYKQILSMSYAHHLLMQTSIHADDGDCEDGFPVIITDMMATGLPVLGSAHCDIPEIIKDDQNGKLAKEGDIEDTAEKLKDLIDDYNEYAATWLNFNTQFIDDNFNAVNCAIQREMLYKKFTALA